MGVEKIGLEMDDSAMIRGLVHIKTASSSCELLAVFYSNPHGEGNQALSSVASSYIVCILAAKARAYFLIRVATSPPFG